MNLIDNILSNGISLEPLGIDSWAENKENILKSIKELEKNNIFILGVDVYELIDNHIFYTTDSCSCDKMNKETDEEYFHHCIIEARRFVEEFPVLDQGEFLFSIIACTSLELQKL